MPRTTDDSKGPAQLRKEAEAQLESGTAPGNTNWTLGVDALHLLHKLSSHHETAEDALKLLNELQVHQVELDLQKEEMAANERAMTEDLKLYRALYEAAPVGHLLIDSRGIIVLANHAAAAFAGLSEDELTGLRIETLLAPAQRPRLLSLLRRAAQGGACQTCMMPVDDYGGTRRQILFRATLAPDGTSIQLACCELQDGG